MFKKNIIEGNKIGKNDNVDIGSNKNIKSKEVIKNSDIHNIEYNPNNVIVELIIDISKKERNILKKVRDLQKCKDCASIVNQKIKLIDDEIDRLNDERNIKKQLSGIVIYNQAKTINKLVALKNQLRNFQSYLSCDIHKELVEEINLDRSEVESLKESLKSLDKK